MIESSCKKSKIWKKITRTVSVFILGLFFVFMPMLIVQAAIRGWASLTYEPNFYSSNKTYDIKDINSNSSQQTTDSSSISYWTKSYSARFFDKMASNTDGSRVTYTKRLYVSGHSGESIALVAAQNDTADAGGSSMNKNNKFYWNVMEYNQDGYTLYDSGWHGMNEEYKLGVTTPNVGAGVYGYNVGAYERKAYLHYIVILFRWDNGDQSVNSGSQLITGDNIYNSYPILKIANKPFNYTFKLNDGYINEGAWNQSSANLTVQRFGITDVDSVPTPTRSGYTFTGWKITSQGGKQKNKVYSADTLASMLKDQKYYSSLFEDATFEAQWTPNQYALTISPNGGAFTDDSGVNDKVCNDPKLIYGVSNYYCINFALPTRKGYTLDGFYDAAIGGTKVYGSNGYCIKGTTYWNNDNNYINDAELKVYAHWTPIEYSIKYDYNDGTGTVVTDKYKYMSTLGNNNRDLGFGHFAQAYTNAWDDNMGYWSEVDGNAYSGKFIYLHCHNHINSGGRGMWYDYEPLAGGRTYTITVRARGKGSWTVGHESEGLQTLSLTDEFKTYQWTFTASGNAYSHFIIYNQGTSNYDWIGFEYPMIQEGGIQSLRSTNSAGNELIGWYTSKDGTDKIEPNQIISGDMTLYGRWEFDIGYDLGGGVIPDGKTNATKYNYLTDTINIINPIKTGYTFKGWTGSNGTSPDTNVSIVNNSTICTS